MLKVNGISKTYSKGSVRAVDDLSLHVRRGEIYGFIGPNGAGKTTTIKIITGILTADSGNITIDGVDIAANPIEAKRKIGYVPDAHDIYDALTGMEYLNFMADMYSVEQGPRREKIGRYLEMFEMAKDAGEPIKSYSHGMRQKIVVIGALLHAPQLWILDEPMTGLDPRAAHYLKEEMHATCERGNTVFFSTHILEVAEKLCDRVGIINKGRLAAEGTLEQLRSGETGESLEHIFLELTEEEGGGR